MNIDFSNDRLDDGGENLWLGYLRESDEFRIAVAKYLEHTNDLDAEFATWRLRWLIDQRKEQS